MIKPSEAVVLTELRKTTLAYLSDSDFQEVEKAVERDGILSLQGSVGTIVKSAVKKHGSHNQSSHGRGGGKGGGGAGGGSAGSSTGSDYLDAVNEEISAAKADIKNRIAGAESAKGNAPRGVNPDVFDARVDGVVAGYKASAKVVGNRKALTKLRQDSSANIPDLPSPSAPLSAFTDRAKAQGFREAVLTISKTYGDLQGDN